MSDAAAAATAAAALVALFSQFLRLMHGPKL